MPEVREVDLTAGQSLSEGVSHGQRDSFYASPFSLVRSTAEEGEENEGEAEGLMDDRARDANLTTRVELITLRTDVNFITVRRLNDLFAAKLLTRDVTLTLTQPTLT